MFFIVVGVVLTFAVVGGLIGNTKGKPEKGFALGLFLGPVGWVLILFDLGLLAVGFALVLSLGVTYLWLRIREDDRGLAARDQMREDALKREQRDRRDDPNSSPGPVTALIHLCDAFQKANPDGEFANPGHRVIYDVDFPGNKTLGELDYRDKDGHEVRLLLKWVHDEWNFQSRAIRKKTVFYTTKNEPGSETTDISPALTAFFVAHGVVVPRSNSASASKPPESAPSPPVESGLSSTAGPANTPPPAQTSVPGGEPHPVEARPAAAHTPAPQEIENQRARAGAAEIARKYGSH